MTSLYNDLDFTNAVDGIDVDRFSMPSSPTHPTRQRNGSINTVGSGAGGGGGGGGGGGDNGLGSLADELAALDYDDDEDEYGEDEEDGEEGDEDAEAEDGNEEQQPQGEEVPGVDDEEEEGQEQVGELPNGVSEDGSGIYSESVNGTTRRRSSTTTSTRTISGHSRTKSKASTLSSPKSKRRSGTARPYNPDGPDSEDDELDDLKDGITQELQERIDQIERLAMEGRKMRFGKSMWSNDSGGGGALGYGLDGSHSYSIPHILHDDDETTEDVIPRLMEGLQKLQPQTTMETAASRLITAHSALSTHMYNETRSLRELAFGLHFSQPPSEETTDLLSDLLELVPRPPLEPFHELSSLRSLTAQLISQLSFISDSLHMARQSSIAANRKLRVAKEACAEWKGELELAERARKHIDEGDWVGKCSRREAAVVCKEVINGFETFCLGVEKDMQAMLAV